MNSTTNTPITTLHQHLIQLAGGLRLPPVAAALQEAGLAHLPVGVVVAVEEARARLEEARGAVAGLAAALHGVAGNAASSVLRCSRLELLDDGGRVRAVLGMSGAGTQTDRAMPDLSFLTATGVPLAHVGAWFDDEAQAELPAIQFNGPGGTDGHAIHGYPDGSVSITADGRETWRIEPTGEAGVG